MKYLAIAILMAMTLASTAKSQSSDSEQCKDNNHPDAAIMACTRLISATGENSKLDLWALYENRGFAYLNRDDCLHHGECELAIGDFTRAIGFDSKDSDAFDGRGRAYESSGRYDLAVTDYVATLKSEDSTPQYGTWEGDIGIGFHLGRDEFVIGRYADAAEDLALFMKDPDPKNSVYVDDFVEATLWLHLARAKTGTDDTAEFSHNVSLITKTDPLTAALYNLYLGKATRAKVFAAAPADDTDARCEADFFVAEYDLLKKDMTAARQIFRQTHRCGDPYPDPLERLYAAAATPDMNKYDLWAPLDETNTAPEKHSQGMHFDYSVTSLGTFVRRASGTVENPKAFRKQLAKLQPPKGAHGGYGLLGDDRLTGHKPGHGLRVLGRLARKYIRFDSLYVMQPPGFESAGVQSGTFTDVKRLNDTTLGWVFFDLRSQFEAGLKKFLGAAPLRQSAKAGQGK